MPKQFILLMTDTQRLDMVSCYEDVGIKTPCIDALAAQGRKFTKAYTVQPVCGPARSALFTGQFPCVNGSYANCTAPGLNVKHIGERLSDRGVHTGYIGKWHLDGGDYFGLGRCPSGWDPEYWYDMRRYLEEMSDADRFRSRQSGTNKERIPAEFTFAHRVSDRAIAFLQAHRDDDFLLVVSYDEPHDPSLCPEPYASMYLDYELPKRPNVYDTLAHKPEHQQVWAGSRRTQDRDALRITAPWLFGCNSFVDSQIGRVVAAADTLLDSHKVLYTTDHGVMLDSHCLYAKGPAAYGEIAHVPLIVRGFGRGEVETPVSHIDIAPTVWQFFGFEPPQMLQGESLLPLLRGEAAPARRDVFIEFGRYETDHDGFGGFQPMRCIYDGRYKLVLNLLTSDELYDLERDPYEMENRIQDPELSEARQALLYRLLAHMDAIRDPMRGYYWENRPWNRQPAHPPSWEYTGFTRQREELAYEPPQLDYMTGLPAEELVRTKAETPKLEAD